MAEGPALAGWLGSGSVHMQNDGEQDPIWLTLLKRFGLMVGLFVAGAITAFVYSYIPLHNAKNWEIDYLTERLEAKDEQLVQLETKLSAAEADVTGRPDADTFQMLQDELDTADKTIKDLERRLAKSKKHADEIEKARTHWKKKYDAAEHARSAAVSAASAAPPASPGSAAGDDAQDAGLNGPDVELQADLVH